DGDPWPLAGLRRIAFRRDDGETRLCLDTPFRRWASPPVSHRFGRAQQAVLVSWLREARDRARSTVRTQQELRDRTRAATAELTHRVPSGR
ncbi:MAG: hypothetical protein AAF602_05600, partial [Myxococcota bacterium]